MPQKTIQEWRCSLAVARFMENGFELNWRQQNCRIAEFNKQLAHDMQIFF